MRFKKVNSIEPWDEVWTRRVDYKVNCVAEAFVQYIVLPDNSDEPLFALGLYHPSTLDNSSFIWFVPGRGFRPIHWRGAKKLLALLRSLVPNLVAYVDETDPKAKTLVRGIGMEPVAGDEKERMYRWPH